MEMERYKNNVQWLNLTFIIWLICEIMFSYSIISRLALMLFVGMTLIVTHRISLSYSWIWYGLFVLWSAANIWNGYAVSERLATEMTQTVGLNLLFLCLFVCYCRYVGDIGQVLKIYKWVIFAFCIPCCIGGIGAVVSGNRLTILGINENIIAMQAAYASIIFINDLISKPREERRLNEWFIVLFLLVTILMTGSRKGLIIPVVGVYVLMCFRRPGKFVLYTLSIIVAVVIILFLLLNVDVLYDLIGYRVEPVLQYLQGESFEEASLDTRNGYIQLGWEQSKYSPIWGYGLDCFRTMRYSYGTYSHCNYIELLYSLGWVGVVIYYYPYVYALSCAPKAARTNRPLVALVLALLVPYIICDYMNVTYFTRTSLIIPTMAMCVLRKGGSGNENTTIS